MRTTRIDGRGVFLRRAELHDFQDWLELWMDSQEYLAQFEIAVAPRDVSFSGFAQTVENDWQAIEDGRGYPFLIFREAGDLVGGLTIGPIASRVGRLGTWIGRRYVGKGYALRAVEAALTFAFDKVGLERVEAITLGENVAAGRVLEHCGFVLQMRREAYLVRGEERGHLVYSTRGRNG